MAPLTRMAFSKAVRVRIADMRTSSPRPARRCACRHTAASTCAAAVDGGNRARCSGARCPSAFDHARPWSRPCPWSCRAGRAVHADSRPRGTPRATIRPIFRSSARRQASVPEPTSRPRKLAVQHRPARQEDGRQVDARRPHEQRGRGLVAAGEEDDAVERVGADAISSTSMLARLRNSMAVGRISDLAEAT